MCRTHSGERTKAAETKIRLQIVGQIILTHLSQDAGDLRAHWPRDDELRALLQAKNQRPRTKEHAYLPRYYHVSRPYQATEPQRRQRCTVNMGSPKPISKTYGVTRCRRCPRKG
jgi:hypothetical protein